jgi:hypothetical protein
MIFIGQLVAGDLLARHGDLAYCFSSTKHTIVGGFYPRCRRRSKCWSISFGKKHGILTKEQVSTLRPAMTAALERTAYRRFEVVKELNQVNL